MTPILKIERSAESGEFSFAYCEASSQGKDPENIESLYEISLRPGQVRMCQVLCEYALPSLLGWQAMINPACVGE